MVFVQFKESQIATNRSMQLAKNRRPEWSRIVKVNQPQMGNKMLQVQYKCSIRDARISFNKSYFKGRHHKAILLCFDREMDSQEIELIGRSQ